MSEFSLVRPFNRVLLFGSLIVCFATSALGVTPNERTRLIPKMPTLNIQDRHDSADSADSDDQQVIANIQNYRVVQNRRFADCSLYFVGAARIAGERAVQYTNLGKSASVMSEARKSVMRGEFKLARRQTFYSVSLIAALPYFVEKYSRTSELFLRVYNAIREANTLMEIGTKDFDEDTPFTVHLRALLAEVNKTSSHSPLTSSVLLDRIQDLAIRHSTICPTLKKVDSSQTRTFVYGLNSLMRALVGGEVLESEVLSEEAATRSFDSTDDYTSFRYHNLEAVEDEWHTPRQVESYQRTHE